MRVLISIHDFSCKNSLTIVNIFLHINQRNGMKRLHISDFYFIPLNSRGNIRP